MMKILGIMKKQKNIINDSLLNLIAAALPVFILQIIILPIVSKVIGIDGYGQAITLISFSTLSSLPLGNVLNNIRLLENEKYVMHKEEGDFNVLLIMSIVLNSLIILLGVYIYSTSLLDIILVIIFANFSIIREYTSASFRLRLNYKYIVFSNFLYVVGLLIGFGLFLIFKKWALIYVFGNLFSVLYNLKNTSFLQEKVRRTTLFKKTTIDSIVLLVSTFIKTSTSYIDKLMLFPLIGSGAVSIYYAANIIGKMISFVATPMSNVFLSYLIKVDKISNKKFTQILIFNLIFGLVMYFVTLVVGRVLLFYLYPEIFEKTVYLLPVSAFSSILIALISILNPFIIRFLNLKWQIVLNLSSLVLYLILSLILYKNMGLIGFSIGIALAYLVQYIIMIIVFYKNNNLNT